MTLLIDALNKAEQERKNLQGDKPKMAFSLEGEAEGTLADMAASKPSAHQDSAGPSLEALAALKVLESQVAASTTEHTARMATSGRPIINAEHSVKAAHLGHVGSLANKNNNSAPPKQTTYKVPLFLAAALAVLIIGGYFFWTTLSPSGLMVQADPSKIARIVGGGGYKGVETAKNMVGSEPSRSTGMAGIVEAATTTTVPSTAPSTASIHAPNEMASTNHQIATFDEPRVARYGQINRAPIVKAVSPAKPAKPRQTKANVMADTDSAMMGIRRLPDKDESPLIPARNLLEQQQWLEAEPLYRQHLRHDRHNIEAMQSLAVIGYNTGRPEMARQYLQKVLDHQPNHAFAKSVLSVLKAESSDSQESVESSQMTSGPAKSHKFFILGNRLAEQGRWVEAQNHFFEAWSQDPVNADYAYNLAVALDHLGKPNLALDYYKKALALSAKRLGQFSVSALQQRVSQLENPSKAPSSDSATDAKAINATH